MTFEEMRRARIARAREMAGLFRDGQTLQQIGDRYGVTRERVRQLLAEIGVSGKQGGVAKRGRDSQRRKKIERDRRYFRKCGCSYAEYKRIRGDVPYRESPQHIYLRQKNSAKFRGIEWRFNLKSWWDVWEASGKWDRRGKYHGQYVMARFNDQGPYSPDNVRICLNTENILEYYEREWNGDYTDTLNRALESAS